MSRKQQLRYHLVCLMLQTVSLRFKRIPFYLGGMVRALVTRQ
ncbi:MAG: hypothetical protein V4507_04395 [Verrucomicrobiota bacterium]